MTAFSADDLARFRDTEEIRIAPYSEDGFLYDGRLIWVVVAEDRVFIRSWKGAEAEWFVRAVRSLRAQITIDDDPGFMREVSLRSIRDADAQPKVDSQYLTTYPQPYASAMASPPATDTTLEVVPV